MFGLASNFVNTPNVFFSSLFFSFLLLCFSNTAQWAFEAWYSAEQHLALFHSSLCFFFKGNSCCKILSGRSAILILCLVRIRVKGCVTLDEYNRTANPHGAVVYATKLKKFSDNFFWCLVEVFFREDICYLLYANRQRFCTNVVYQIPFPECQWNSIGETKGTFATR